MGRLGHLEDSLPSPTSLIDSLFACKVGCAEAVNQNVPVASMFIYTTSPRFPFPFRWATTTTFSVGRTSQLLCRREALCRREDPCGWADRKTGSRTQTGRPTVVRATLGMATQATRLNVNSNEMQGPISGRPKASSLLARHQGNRLHTKYEEWKIFVLLLPVLPLLPPQKMSKKGRKIRAISPIGMLGLRSRFLARFSINVIAMNNLIYPSGGLGV